MGGYIMYSPNEWRKQKKKKIKLFVSWQYLLIYLYTQSKKKKKCALKIHNILWFNYSVGRQISYKVFA